MKSEYEMEVQVVLRLPGRLVEWAQKAWPPVNIAKVTCQALLKAKKRRDGLEKKIDRMVQEEELER